MPARSRRRTVRQGESNRAPIVRLVEEKAPFHPSWLLLLFFALLIAVGTYLLWLPRSTTSGSSPPLLDTLFTAASAATGTGLVIYDTATYWSPFGLKVLFALIQIGGLGALVGSTLFLLLIIRRARSQERSLFKYFLRVQSGLGLMGLVLGILCYALLMEAAGTYFLFRQLSPSLPREEALWQGMFHSASAFNNAGFQTLSQPVLAADPRLMLILSGLVVVGGFSFVIVIDLVRMLALRPLSLDTKLSLITTFWLLVLGTGVLLWPQLSGAAPGMSFPQKLTGALFHSVNARTAGLVAENLASLAPAVLLMLIALMFIGGTAGSSAGGIKVNTFGLLAAATWSFVRGHEKLEVLGKSVHPEQIYRAQAMAFLSVLLVFVVTFLLSITEKQPLLSLLFESVSAFSTTGYSLGITAGLTPTGKWLIIATMFAGRVGPLTLAYALSQLRRPSTADYAHEAINLG